MNMLSLILPDKQMSIAAVGLSPPCDDHQVMVYSWELLTCTKTQDEQGSR